MTMNTATNQAAKQDQIIIFDTTLRDGEQSPGAAMTKEEKIRIARQLEKLGVNVIEAGFAAASPGDFESISEIAKIIKNSTVCSLARASENDVRRAGEAIKHAASGRIHTFIATSKIHMENKLRMTEDQVVERAVQAVKWALEYTKDVEFSAEDAVRSDMDFLVRVFDAVIEAGATTINVPDTVGYSIPAPWGERMATLIKRVKSSDKVVWSTHCHNDLGMAVANSLAAVMNGARQVECTINGLGERAGNASLEEVVMAIKRSILCIQRGEYKTAEQMLHIALKLAQDFQNRDAVTYIHDVLANLVKIFYSFPRNYLIFPINLIIFFFKAYEVGDFKKSEKLFVEVMKELLASGKTEDDPKMLHISSKLAHMLGNCPISMKSFKILNFFKIILQVCKIN